MDYRSGSRLTAALAPLLIHVTEAVSVDALGEAMRGRDGWVARLVLARPRWGVAAEVERVAAGGK